MRGSWKLGTVAGIGIYMHFTFLLLPALIGFREWGDSHSFAKVLGSIGFILTLFGCVVLHELGHALSARMFGIRTRDISLLPIGGVARLERMPDKPSQELLVALAGPAVNMLIVAGLMVWLVFTASLAILTNTSLMGESFIFDMMAVNTMLAIFNLLPAFPMDGGRVLRALLATRLNYARATRIAATIGKLMAIAFGVAGWTWGQPMLILIAFFVWIGGAQEAAMANRKALLDQARERGHVDPAMAEWISRQSSGEPDPKAPNAAPRTSSDFTFTDEFERRFDREHSRHSSARSAGRAGFADADNAEDILRQTMRGRP